MNDEKAWRDERLAASGHRIARMDRFIAKHGSKRIRGEMRRKKQHEQRRADRAFTRMQRTQGRGK